jgi:osmotically-inducible protein OsmY
LQNSCTVIADRATRTGAFFMSNSVTHSSLFGHTARRVLLAALLVGSVVQSGCAVVAVSGFTAGALAISDRRTIGAQTEDQGIEIKAMQHLSQLSSAGNISVTSFNRKVLLSGQAENDKIRREAAGIVSRIENVKMVHNELVVGPKSSLTTRANDAGLTTRIKAMMLDAKDLQANTIKVITENNVAYLMGIVTRAEGDRAAMVASRVSGVRRVVTVFEYVSPDELARIQRALKGESSR